jgi:hypothetical protein
MEKQRFEKVKKFLMVIQHGSSKVGIWTWGCLIPQPSFFSSFSFRQLCMCAYIYIYVYTHIYTMYIWNSYTDPFFLTSLLGRQEDDSKNLVLWVKFWILYLYTMEFYAAMKKNEMLSLAGKWMELENIILSEVSLAQKTKNRMFSLICGH